MGDPRPNHNKELRKDSDVASCCTLHGMLSRNIRLKQTYPPEGKASQYEGEVRPTEKEQQISSHRLHRRDIHVSINSRFPPRGT